MIFIPPAKTTTTCLRCQRPLFFKADNWWCRISTRGIEQETTGCPDARGAHVPASDPARIERWLAS